MRITILGTGFAALTAIQEIRKKSPVATITVIAPSQEFIYLPSLVWIPSGIRKNDDIKINLHNFFNRQNVQFTQARVQNITNGGRTVITEQGEYQNDGLIIATGGRFLKKLPGIEHAITPCEGLTAVNKIKDRLDSMSGGTIAIGFSGNSEEPSAMRGGPMLEFLFGIETLLRKQGRRNNFKIIFFNPSPKPGLRLGDKAPDALLKMMKKRNIETQLGNKILGFEPNKVKMENNEFDADLILFMPGISGPEWTIESDMPLSEGGLIKANEFCQVEGLSKTYVAGDSGSFPGPDWQGKQAHSADLQAKAASHNLLAELNESSELKPFTNEIICIVDTLSHGVFIKRTESKTIMLPPCRLMHFAKLAFEWWYLRKYR